MKLHFPQVKIVTYLKGKFLEDLQVKNYFTSPSDYKLHFLL